MLTTDGRAKVVDFGLSKLTVLPAGGDEATWVGDSMTAPHAVLGTAGYMAPEQVAGLTADARSDQFALGAILYEMLTGRRAFRRETSVQTLASILDDEPAHVSTLRPDTPPSVAQIVGRCLAKRPDDRYLSTRVLARELREELDALVMESRSSHSGRHLPARRRGWLPSPRCWPRSPWRRWGRWSGPAATRHPRRRPPSLRACGRLSSCRSRTSHGTRGSDLCRGPRRDADEQPDAARTLPTHPARGPGKRGPERTADQCTGGVAGLRRHPGNHRVGATWDRHGAVDTQSGRCGPAGAAGVAHARHRFRHRRRYCRTWWSAPRRPCSPWSWSPRHSAGADGRRNRESRAPTRHSSRAADTCSDSTAGRRTSRVPSRRSSAR